MASRAAVVKQLEQIHERRRECFFDFHGFVLCLAVNVTANRLVLKRDGITLPTPVKPDVFTHEGQEIKLCCKDCLKDFKKEPAKYTAKLKTAGTEKK